MLSVLIPNYRQCTQSSYFEASASLSPYTKRRYYLGIISGSVIRIVITLQHADSYVCNWSGDYGLNYLQVLRILTSTLGIQVLLVYIRVEI